MAFLRTAGIASTLACAAVLNGPPDGTPAPADAECGCWRYVRPEGSPSDATLGDVTSPSADAGWAVGNKGPAPLLLSWNGVRWREQRLPLPADTVLEGVSATSARDAWVIGPGNDGTARAARWDGHAWTSGALPGGRPVIPRAVHARMPGDAWVVGSSGGLAGNQPAAWRWNGRSWAQVPVNGDLASSGELTAVSARASDDAWAVGSAARARQLLLHWDGTRWKSLPGPQLSEETTLADVVTLRSAEAWAVGSRSSGAPLAERWNGRSWRIVPVPGVKGRFYSVASDGEGGIWAAGEFDTGRPLLAHWNGERWDVSRPPVPDPSGDDPGDGVSAAWAVSHVPGTRHLRAVGWYGRPKDPLRHAITWTNFPRPR